MRIYWRNVQTALPVLTRNTEQQWGYQDNGAGSGHLIVWWSQLTWNYFLSDIRLYGALWYLYLHNISQVCVCVCFASFIGFLYFMACQDHNWDRSIYILFKILSLLSKIHEMNMFCFISITIVVFIIFKTLTSSYLRSSSDI